MPETTTDIMSRIARQKPEHLNAVANAVTEVLGWTGFSKRYAIAILALEAIAAAPEGTTP